MNEDGSTRDLGEYMTARMVEQKPKTQVWEIKNKHHDVPLGTVKWNGDWRQYCFFLEADTVFSSGCMKEIETFLNGLNRDKRSEIQERKKSKTD